MPQKILVYKKPLTTAGVILSCLFLYGIFPTGNVFQQIVSSVAFLLVIPLLYIKIILREPLKNYGLQWGDRRQGILWMGLSLLMALLVFYILFHYTSLFQKYPLPNLVAKRFAFFILYEILLTGLFAFLYEFFFRGLATLCLSGVLGRWPIAFQFVLFTAFFFIAGELDRSIILFSIISPFAGITAYQSRSLLYSFGFGLIFIIIA